MSLEPGRDIAHYHVVGKIGEGGMGEVYRATDTKLGRDVALKRLPVALSVEPERLARFQREAQVLASLNHPNIAAIYGFEQVEGESFLVLEYVEGQDLAEALAAGPLAPDRALDVARQMAEALEVAHERGIVHRDLKPANVKRTPDGQVKILDFGLAKALQSEDPDSSDASLSPTITSLSTRAGVILGTAAYMSPEQARGGRVDRRADIWAFGCVLLELLTGRSPFHEQSVSDTLASVLRSEPDWSRLPGDTQVAVRRLLRRCLEKDPRRRLRDIGEARIALEDVASGAVEDAGAPAAPSTSRRWMPVALAVAVTAVLTFAALQAFRPAPPPPKPRSFEVVAGGFVPASPVLSPDGEAFVFIRDSRLWVRFLDRLDPVPLDGTEGASHAAWSSDSRSIVFAAHGDLMSVPVAGGDPIPIAFGVGEIGSAGGIDVQGDRIVFASGDTSIREVSVHGGDPHDLVVPDGKVEADLHNPAFLPDGSVLYVVHRLVEGADTIAVYHDGRTDYVFQTGGQFVRDPVYASTGHLLYRRDGAKAGVWAAPFSLRDRKLTGEPFLITTNGIAPSVAADDTLMFVRNAGEGGARSQLVWVGRDGTVGDPVGPEMDGVAAPALSPDGSRVVIMRPETEQGNLWVFDVAEGSRTRLTFGSKPAWDPAWTPDGNEILFWEGEMRALARIPVDGSGRAERVVAADLLDSGNPTVSPDGTWVAFWARTGPTSHDVVAVEIDGDGTLVPIVATPAVEHFPQISPDGEYLAYVSNDSGRFEVYLTRFPSGEGRWQVSVQGGSFPRWSPVGDELFYLSGTVLQAVNVTLTDVPRLGEPVALFDAVDANVNVGWNQRYEVSRDGTRFLMVKDRQNEDAPPGIVLEYDWLAAARAR